MNVPFSGSSIYVNHVFYAAVVVAVLAGCLAGGTPTAASDRPGRVEIHTVSGLPVAVPPSLRDRTTVVLLDRLPAIEAALSEGLHRIPSHRRPDAVSRGLTPGLREELKRTWKVLEWIRRGRITHLPAIVLDGRAVWYGSDPSRAVARYRARTRAGDGS